MLQCLAAPLRLLLLLALFVASGAGHHAAMAKSILDGPVHQHSMIEDHHQTVERVVCHGTECAHTDQSCCVMGQCLIGIAPEAMPAILPEPGMVQVPNYCRAGNEAFPRQPFRPPA